MRIDKIQVLDRHRADMGDLTDLAASIATDGLLHPVVVTTEGRMIAGHRRLEACRSLGWTDIKVTFIDGLLDAAQLLRMERDENTCRKDMTPSEKVSLGCALEELERPKAKAAQIEAGQTHGRGIASVPPNESNRRQSYDVREDVAPAVGMSTATYSRAKQLVTAAANGDVEAKAQVEEMDKTGKVTKPYETWKGYKVNRGDDAETTRGTAVRVHEVTYIEQHAAKWGRIAALAASGSASSQIAREVGMSEAGVKSGAKDRGIDIRADRVLGRVHRLDSNRIIRESVSALENIVNGFALINYDDIDMGEADEWTGSLEKSRTALSQAIAQIKKRKPIQ